MTDRAALRDVQRYTIVEDGDQVGAYMELDPDGEWVQWKEVLAALAGSGPEAGLRERIAGTLRTTLPAWNVPEHIIDLTTDRLVAALAATPTASPTDPEPLSCCDEYRRNVASTTASGEGAGEG